MDTRVVIGSDSGEDALPFRSTAAAGPTFFVADARTRERELIPEVSGRTERDIHLLWIR